MDIIDQNVIELADTSCRILVVAPTVEQATYLIQRLDEFASTRLPAGVTKEPLPEPIQSPEAPGLHKIPWTLFNRYYTAKIHFAIHTMHGLSPHQVRNAPAVIFTWTKGEAYRHHVLRLSQDMHGYDMEVSLAVRTQDETLAIVDPEEETAGVEDTTEIDGFLSEHGFEFVDARGDYAPQRSTRSEEEDDYSDEDTPHIPRVLDALSTVMWPSMQMRGDERAGPQRAGSARGKQLLDWAQGSEDDSLGAASRDSNARRMRQEMEELARWLEEDNPTSMQREDPWKTAATTGQVTSSPTSDEFDIHSNSGKGPGKQVTLKFEDDFTVFVSAPPVQGQVDSGSSTPGPLSPTGLQPGIAGSLYNTLGSASDVGDTKEENREERKDDSDAGDSDDELPTQEEIREATSRIFGSNSESEKRPSAMEATSSLQSSTLGHHFGEEAFSETFSFDDNESGEYEIARFDLTRVLGALQDMKTEIAGIEDEGERRKAAARVALGLVYGLEAGEGVRGEAGQGLD